MWQKPVAAAAKQTVLQSRPLILVGAGNLGHSLCSNYTEFEHKGYKIVAAFDNDPGKCGKEFGHIKEVEHISNIKRTVQDSGAMVAILAIPGKEAQQITQQCVDAGINTILNYTPIRLEVPSHVHVENMDPALRVEQAIMLTPKPRQVSAPRKTNVGYTGRMLGLCGARGIDSGLVVAPLINLLRSRTRFVRSMSTATHLDPACIAGLNTLNKLTERYMLDFSEISLLGRGGYGSVFSARNYLDHNQYAIKRVEMNIRADDKYDFSNHRYLREVRAMAKMNHPNVIRYFHSWMEKEPDAPSAVYSDDQSIYSDSAETGTAAPSTISGPAQPHRQLYPVTKKALLYICMEFCSGATLRELMAQPGFVLTQNQAKEILCQILEGLKHVHDHGFIHRDITPSNIFITESNQIKIGDFGLSCGESQASMSEGIAQPNALKTAGLGTLLYASPEQLSMRQYDNRTDVFSVGMILFELLHPFKTQMERMLTMSQVKLGNIPPNFAIRFPRETDMIRQLAHVNFLKRPTVKEALERLNMFDHGYILSNSL